MGGPSQAQKDAQAQTLSNAKNEGALANQSAGKFNALYGQTQPFYANEMANGLPFYNDLADYNSGDTARAYAPAYGDLNRRLSSMGSLPSGFATAARSDLSGQRANAFDSQLKQAQFANFGAKQQGAQGLAGLMQTVNPAAFYGGSTAAAGQGMQPLQPQQNPWQGVLGGAVGGGLSAIPW
jgi:hypothetical protein